MGENSGTEFRREEEVVCGVFQIVMNRTLDDVIISERQRQEQGQGRREVGDIDQTVEIFSMVAKAVMLTTQLLQHKGEEEEFRLKLQVDSNELTARTQQVEGECSSWRDTSEMWRSVTGGALALLSARVVDDDTSFDQAVLLVKQNKNLIQGLMTGKEYAITKERDLKRMDRIESIAKMTAEPKEEVKRKKASTSEKLISTSYKHDDEILDQRFQAIRALKSILSATSCLEAKTAENPPTVRYVGIDRAQKRCCAVQCNSTLSSIQFPLAPLIAFPLSCPLLSSPFLSSLLLSSFLFYSPLLFSPPYAGYWCCSQSPSGNIHSLVEGAH